MENKMESRFENIPDSIIRHANGFYNEEERLEIRKVLERRQLSRLQLADKKRKRNKDFGK